MPTALIAEDEPLLVEELTDALGRLWPELEVVARARDGIDAVRLVEEHRPDVVFLDIQMPGMTGLDVARQLGNRAHVVFVTAFDQHAVTAFEQGAVDYVLKPVTIPRLAMAVSRVKERMGRAPGDISGVLRELAAQRGDQRSYLRWVNASVGQTIKLITVEEICYFKADNKYTLVVTPTAESLIKKPIKELSDELDPAQFWQIHRGTLVNMAHVAAVTRDLRGQLQLKLKQRNEALPVSESYTHLFRQM
ncbi:MAG: LytTR family DNA-binding domain-containing protein [Burkholderiales bacterium]